MSTARRRLLVDLPDGRVLAGRECGDPQGRPILYFHGTPGSAVEVEALEAAALDAGVRLIGLDRPGIGGSSLLPGRRVAGWADDVVDATTALGLDAPGVIGYSGGGPYALACAVARSDGSAPLGPVAVVAGAGPIGSRADMRAMDPTDLTLTVLGARLPRTGGFVVGTAGRFLRRFPGIGLRLWTMGLSGADRAVLHGASGPARTLMVELGDVLASSGRGVIDDERALAARWGFDAADVTLPVRWWHGERDTVVPFAGVEPFVSRLPDATLSLVPDGGHLLMPRLAAEVFAVLR